MIGISSAAAAGLLCTCFARESSSMCSTLRSSTWPCRRSSVTSASARAADRTPGLLAHSEPTAAALNAGYHVAYLAAAALVAAAIALALAVLRPRRAAPVHHGVTAGRAVAAPCSEAA